MRLAITSHELQLKWLQSPAVLYMEDVQETAGLSEGAQCAVVTCCFLQL